MMMMIIIIIISLFTEDDILSLRLSNNNKNFKITKNSNKKQYEKSLKYIQMYTLLHDHYNFISLPIL